MTQFTCNLSQEPTPFPHVWEHTVGSGHANPQPVWEAMGAPTYPDRHQLHALAAEGRLVREPLAWEYDPELKMASVDVQLTPQSVTAVRIEW